MKTYAKNTLTSSLEKGLPKKAFLFDAKQVAQLKSAGQIVLSLAGAAGVVAVGLVAPNALKLFKSVPSIRRSLRKSNRPAKRVAQTFYYLKRKGYVSLSLKNGEVFVTITEKGKERLLELNYENLKIAKNREWDGRWWFVMADIPTKDHRNEADALRRKIRKLGLYPLQRSVWVYPYDPTDAITFVSGRLSVDRYVTVLRADKVEEEDERVLKGYFKGLEIH